MLRNNVNLFLDQQYGVSKWRECDSILRRLKCSKENAYINLLPAADDFEFYRDTPIFACKYAVQENYGHFVALANEDGKLAIHNSDNGSRFGLTAHNNAIFDLAWMFDQMKIVTASGDHSSKLYDVGNGELKEVKVFCGHTRSVKTVSFRKDDSSVFASGGRDGNVILWDIRTDQHSFIGKADRTISNAHLSNEFTPSKLKRKYGTPNSFGVKSVTGLVFQNETTLISCGAGDGTIKIWDLRKNYTANKKEPIPKNIISYKGTTSKKGYSNLLIDENGILLYANCLDSTIYCYNISSYSNEPVIKYVGHQNNTFYIKSSLSRGGRYLLSGSSDENAYIWNTKYSKPLIKLRGHSAEVTCVAWCQKNLSVVTCSDDMTHKFWKIGEDDDCTGYGDAESLSLTPLGKNGKRISISMSQCDNTIPQKKFLVECKCCKTAPTAITLCRNCIISSKRKAESGLENENKRPHNEFGPRCLFANTNNVDNVENHDKLADILGEDEKHELRLLKIEASGTELLKSPTVNLPNYVLDGTAPHLSYSPPKKRSQDWLTRMRIERNLRQEMIERTHGPSSPKMPKIELTPKSTKKSWTPKSPLLKFFKVTNNKCESGTTCSKIHHNCNYSSPSYSQQ